MKKLILNPRNVGETEARRLHSRQDLIDFLEHGGFKKETAEKLVSPEFVAVKSNVMRGSESIAIARSKTMAKRIANALNAHKTNSEGV